jgi:hypothetical protein
MLARTQRLGVLRAGKRLFGVVAPLAVLAMVLAGCAGSGGEQAAEIKRFELPNAQKVLTEQRRGDWCWAACAEMALKYKGVRDITQEMLVDSSLRRNAENQTVEDFEILFALAYQPKGSGSSGEYLAQRGNVVDVGKVKFDKSMVASGAGSAASMYLSPSAAVEDFIQGHPVLLGLKDWEGAPGHIVFVTAVEYQERWDKGFSVTDVFDEITELFPKGKVAENETIVGAAKTAARTADERRYVITAIEFHDPMPGQGGHTRLSREELDKHYRFTMTSKRSREVLGNLLGSVEVR